MNPLSRRRFLQAATVAGMAAVARPPLIAAPSSPPDEFSIAAGVRQLFLDDFGVEEIRGLRRVVNSPERHPRNPLISPDTAWERGCQVYGTAFFDESRGLFRLWYLTNPKERGTRPLVVDGLERPPHTTLVAYAESNDGVKWTKPDLGQFPYDGDRHNNLVNVGRHNVEGIAILHDTIDADPLRRYKALFWDHGSGGWSVVNGAPRTRPGPQDGIWVAWSPDGLRWTNYEKIPVIPQYSDTNQVLLYDPQIERYVAFGRFGFGRKLARSESQDFLTWSKPQLVLECDQRDGPSTQIYGAGIDLYEGLYLGMIWIYREGGDATIDTQLAVSRDGVKWTRVGERATWLALGDPEGWEGGMVRSVERIIVRGDRLFIYYCGVHGPHGRPGRPPVERKHPVQIGLLQLRRDGFVSLDSGDQSGTVTTRPFALPVGGLHVNLDAGAGELRAELLDPAGSVVARSAPLKGDLPAGAVAWEQPPPQAGTRVRLRLALQSGKLYSYWFSQAQG